LPLAIASSARATLAGPEFESLAITSSVAKSSPVQAGQPSRTALAAATHRAAHQILERGSIFSDALAVRIIGGNAEAIARDAAENPSRSKMRGFIAARTRFAEDSLGAAVAQGTTQLVILGAGLDTFAYRNPFGERLRVFEVDHPATQEWKRNLLKNAGIAIPNSLIYAPVDFERQTLIEGLSDATFDAAQKTFFTWLGVVPYLTAEAIWSTLSFIAGLPNGSHVVFDYSDPPETLSAEMRAFHDERAARVKEIGEGWVSYFEADTLRTKLLALGFTEVEDLGPREIMNRYFPTRSRIPPERGGHILRASKT
jgi:methyltransferase (TIGR00027 family)